MATSLIAPQAGDLVRATDVGPIADLINGTPTADNIPVALINHLSASNYSLRVRNQATGATTPIAKFSYNTGGSETTVLDITAAGISGAKFFDKGGSIINVKAYAAGGPNSVGFGGSTTADTLAIEAAIADLKAQSLAQFNLGAGDGRLMRIHFPAGTWNIFRTIDLSGLVGTRISGDGVQATRFGLASASGSDGTALYWSTKPMMDVTGGNFIRLENFAIQPSNTGASSAIPEVGLLMAGNAAFTNWIGSAIPANVANANYLDTVRVAGAFRIAAHANFACPSSVYVRCDFTRNLSNNATYPNGQNGNQAALLLTRDNIGPAGALLVHAGGAVGLMNSTTDGVSCSDLTFIDCEVHDECQASGGGGSCFCPALWMDEVYDARFYGGNISGHSNSMGYIRMCPGRLAGAVETTGCRNILLDGLFMYPAEGGGAIVPVAIKVTGNTSPDDAAIVRSHLETWPNDSDTVPIAASDVTIRNTQVSLAAGGGLIGGGKASGAGGHTAYLIRWHVENVQIKDNAVPFTLNESYLLLAGGTDVLEARDCYLEAHGNKIATNGGAIVRGTLIRPGAVTTSRIYHGEFTLSGGAQASVTAGTTFYFGLGAGSSTESGVTPVTIPMGMKVWYLRVVAATAPGSGQTFTCTLRSATPSTTAYASVADSGVTCTISGTSTIGHSSAGATNLSLLEGQVVNVKVVASAGATTSGWFSWSLVGSPE